MRRYWRKDGGLAIAGKIPDGCSQATDEELVDYAAYELPFLQKTGNIITVRPEIDAYKKQLANEKRNNMERTIKKHFVNLLKRGMLLESGEIIPINEEILTDVKDAEELGGITFNLITHSGNTITLQTTTSTDANTYTFTEMRQIMLLHIKPLKIWKHAAIQALPGTSDTVILDSDTDLLGAVQTLFPLSPPASLPAE